MGETLYVYDNASGSFVEAPDDALESGATVYTRAGDSYAQYDPSAPPATADAGKPENPEAGSAAPSGEGQLLGLDGTPDLVRVRYGEGDDVTSKAGRLVVDASGSVTFKEATTEEGGSR